MRFTRIACSLPDFPDSPKEEQQKPEVPFRQRMASTQVILCGSVKRCNQVVA